MASILIQNFGPIKKCKLNISDTNFMVITGRQASGKSTVVKSIYFFKAVKEVLMESLRKYSISGDELFKNAYYTNFSGYFRTNLRTRFMELFGTSQNMEKSMKVRYDYSEDVYIELGVKNRKFDNTGKKIDNYLEVTFGSPIFTFLNQIKMPLTSDDIKKFYDEFEDLIDDHYTPYFVPAGRCLMSLLTSQLNYFMISMDDHQKKLMDYCTRKFIEIISKLKDMFSSGMDFIASDNMFFKKNAEFKKVLKLMNQKTKEILKGEYRIINGEERLYLEEDNEKYVKINYTSSGQQEILWIVNLLYYIVSSKTKAFIIIEEPESHLYPDAQKVIMELIAIAANNGCQIVTTTHSPYVLGTLNNLKFAAYLANNSCIKDEVYNIIPEAICLDSLEAYYVQNGGIELCLEDMDGELIDNTLIDGASQLINDDLDSLFELYGRLFESEE